MLIPSGKIFLDKSKIAGRGVFARQRIYKDEIIEIAPVIILPQMELNQLWRELNITDMHRFVFTWESLDSTTGALAMGYGSFYNHSERPNAAFIPVALERAIKFIALRDIEKGEEIMTNYGYDIKTQDVRKY